MRPHSRRVRVRAEAASLLCPSRNDEGRSLKCSYVVGELNPSLRLENGLTSEVRFVWLRVWHRTRERSPVFAVGRQLRCLLTIMLLKLADAFCKSIVLLGEVLEKLRVGPAFRLQVAEPLICRRPPELRTERVQRNRVHRDA